jgi:hypothetical protein
VIPPVQCRIRPGHPNIITGPSNNSKPDAAAALYPQFNPGGDRFLTAQ